MCRHRHTDLKWSESKPIYTFKSDEKGRIIRNESKIGETKTHALTTPLKSPALASWPPIIRDSESSKSLTDDASVLASMNVKHTNHFSRDEMKL